MNRTQQLERRLTERGLDYKVEYRRKWPQGWFILLTNPQRLGYNWRQAMQMIDTGNIELLTRK